MVGLSYLWKDAAPNQTVTTWVLLSFVDSNTKSSVLYNLILVEIFRRSYQRTKLLFLSAVKTWKSLLNTITRTKLVFLNVKPLKTSEQAKFHLLAKEVAY